MTSNIQISLFISKNIKLVKQPTPPPPPLPTEQALQGDLAARPEKEGELATTSLEFEYLHGKVDEKYRSAEMI